MTRPGETKLKWHLFPMEEAEIVAEVFHKGAEKHQPFGWQTIPDAHTQYSDALMRHWVAYCKGEKTDPDDGLPALAHLIADAFILLWHDRHEKKDSVIAEK